MRKTCGDDNPRIALPRSHPQRARGADLCVGNGLKPATKVLGKVSSAIEAEGCQHDHIGRHVNAHGTQPKPEKEKLEQRRRVTRQLDPG